MNQFRTRFDNAATSMSNKLLRPVGPPQLDFVAIACSQPA